MEIKGDKATKSPFTYKVVSVENQPRVYVSPQFKEEEHPKTKDQERHHNGEKGLLSFFGRHLEKIFSSSRSQEEDLPPIEEELGVILEGIQKKLQAVQAARKTEMDVASREKAKHEKLIKDRNRSQVLMFKDIGVYHRKFGTGLKKKDLFSLHGFMTNAANHEMDCSSHEMFHKHIECNVLSFLREKAQEKAWESLEGYLDQFSISFPVPESMLDHKDALRNEKVIEERKKTTGEDFRKIPPQQLAEMILGNIPVWVYSYPEKGSYLWLLTVLQGVAAGLAAKLFLGYLGFWEKNSPKLLKRIAIDYREKIGAIRERGEKAVDLVEVFNVSRELQRISKEEIPNFIWSVISIDLKNESPVDGHSNS